MRFSEATALERFASPSGNQSSLSYSGAILPDWDIVGNANGGYLMALLGCAALKATERPDVITMSANFLGPGKTGPITVDVDPIKTGRRFATVRTGLSAQSVSTESNPLVIATVTTGNLEDGDGPELINIEPPTMPAVQDCPRVEPVGSFPPPFMNQVEVRLHPADTAGDDVGPHFRGWFRLLDEEPMGSLALILAADSLPPTVFNTAIGVGWAPTIQMTIHIRARPKTPWILIDTHSKVITNGMFETDAVVFDEDGLVVAQARQLQLIAKG